MKTIYERPEAEELKLVLEKTFLQSQNTEDPSDPHEEIDI